MPCQRLGFKKNNNNSNPYCKIIVIIVGYKYVLGPAQTHFSPSYSVRVKMSSSEKGPKYIYVQEHKLYYYYYHYEGH